MNKTAIEHIFSENSFFLKIMKKDLVSSETITNFAKQSENVYRMSTMYKKLVNTLCRLKVQKCIKMHQNEYPFSKIFRG